MDWLGELLIRVLCRHGAGKKEFLKLMKEYENVERS